MGAYQEVFLKIFEGKVERTNIDEALDNALLMDKALQAALKSLVRILVQVDNMSTGGTHLWQPCQILSVPRIVF